MTFSITDFRVFVSAMMAIVALVALVRGRHLRGRFGKADIEIAPSLTEAPKKKVQKAVLTVTAHPSKGR